MPEHRPGPDRDPSLRRPRQGGGPLVRVQPGRTGPVLGEVVQKRTRVLQVAVAFLAGFEARLLVKCLNLSQVSSW